ncbi:hypothetical protein VdG1_07525 [Verticillium dahliae VDG1]|nr:hypothetical protein VdG1_07525 [Verticillium dahliae VDG1]
MPASASLHGGRQATKCRRNPHPESWDVATTKSIYCMFKNPQSPLHKLEHLLFVNDRLREYDAITDLLDVFVHIDAEDTSYAYDWRAQQEVALRAERGAGMTPDEVVKFVDGYYPAYELYADALRRGVFPDRPEKQVRMVVGKDRKVKETHVI